jgi:hypothetical protein
MFIALEVRIDEKKEIINARQWNSLVQGVSLIHAGGGKKGLIETINREFTPLRPMNTEPSAFGRFVEVQ